MSFKESFAKSLYEAVQRKKISFHTALKTFGVYENLMGLKNRSANFHTRKKLIKYMIDATGKENKSCWTSVLFPAEILAPFKIYPLVLEVLAGMFANLNIAKDFLKIANEHEVSNTMCSFHRTLHGLSSTNFLDKPLFIGATSIMCDGNSKSFDFGAIQQKVPFLFLDVPFEESNSAIEYVKKQIEQMIEKISDLTKMRLSSDDWKKTSLRCNEALDLSYKFHDELYNSKLPPFKGHEIVNFAFPMHFLLGTKLLIKILNQRIKILKHRSKKAPPSLKRLMWLHIVPQYPTDMWAIIDNSRISKIVCDEYSTPYFVKYDPNDPLLSIAKRLISHPSNGRVERRIKQIIKIAKKFKVDGVIHYSSWGCHQAAGNIQIVQDAIEDEGYKFLNINSDPVDMANSSFEQHRTRLEAFIESL